MKGEIHIH